MFGWGRPVMTSPALYTRRLSRSTSQMLVSVAGPAMNLVLAIICSLAAAGAFRLGVIDVSIAGSVFTYLVQLNLVLMFFNLLPIPPLDGGSVLAWFLPPSLQSVVDFLEKWGFLILIGLFLTGAFGLLMAPAFYLIQVYQTFVYVPLLGLGFP